MAKDPAFLFYPGDYLRDTQNLSEAAQVAYDRIMCEHMRNICITQQQLKFFTKRLNDEEKEELMLMLTKIEGGYQIEWVAESIDKRKAYSESRRNNGKSTKEDVNNISNTYDSHMENENENVIEKEVHKEGSAVKFKFKVPDKPLANILEVVEMNQFTYTKQKNTEFIEANWPTFLKERLAEGQVHVNQFSRLTDLTSYFVNFMRNKFPKTETVKTYNNGSTKNNSSTVGRKIKFDKL